MNYKFSRSSDPDDFTDRPLSSPSQHLLSWSDGLGGRSVPNTDYFDDRYEGNHALSEPDRYLPQMHAKHMTQKQGGSYHHHPSPKVENSFLTSTAEKSFHDEVVSPASHSTRHARRVYVGNMPPGHNSEEQVKNFFNEVISICMDEDHTNNYVLSVYMNHKKNFAFVELSSVDLTEACLQLDGILYCSNILKIQRAKEYKPELISVPPQAPVQFQVSRAPFPGNVPGLVLNAGGAGSDRDLPRPSRPMAAILQYGTVRDVSPGTLAVLGFPYDEGDRRSEIAAGAASACKITRHYLRQALFSPVNPEYGVDLARLSVLDVGDVPLGLTLEEALSRLDDMVAEIARRGGIAIVIGGSGDISYACTAGLISVAGGMVGVMKVDSRLNACNLRVESKIESASVTRVLLSDSRFCPWDKSLLEHTCDERLVLFGLQGLYCSAQDTRFALTRGALVRWLNRDIRCTLPLSGNLRSCAGGATDDTIYDLPRPPSTSTEPTFSALSSDDPAVGASVQKSFARALSSLVRHLRQRPVHVSISMHALCDADFPGKSCHASDGLTAKEMLDICHVAGASHNVTLLDLSGFNPDVEKTRSGVLMAEILYSFLIGFTFRKHPPSVQLS